jgi:RimJ/RimL family protein N-acetyltransferase
MVAPSLRSKRFVLLPLSPADLDEATAIFADARVMRYVDGATRDRASTARALEANQRCWTANGWGLWAIRDASSGAFLGQGGLQPATEVSNAAVELSIIINQRNWGKGVATEAGHLIVFDAWTRYAGHKIHAIVHPDNSAAGPVLRKLGFRHQDDELIRGETLQLWQTQRLA